VSNVGESLGSGAVPMCFKTVPYRVREDSIFQNSVSVDVKTRDTKAWDEFHKKPSIGGKMG